MYKVIMQSNYTYSNYEIGQYKTKSEAIMIIQSIITKELIESNEINGTYRIEVGDK